MAKLEDLKQGAQIKGIDPAGPVTVIQVKWFGSEVVELTYRDQKGQPDTELLYRDREAVPGCDPPWHRRQDSKLDLLMGKVPKELKG